MEIIKLLRHVTVVVKKNPLHSASSLLEAVMVMKGGTVVARNNQTH